MFTYLSYLHIYMETERRGKIMLSFLFYFDEMYEYVKHYDRFFTPKIYS